jgi:hypothetical protein
VIFIAVRVARWRSASQLDRTASHGPRFPSGALICARLNSGVQSVLVKERFRPADLVERIRRLVHKKPEVISGMEAAS